MQQFQSLQRLLIFYTLTLLAMLSVYYVTMFYEIRQDSKQDSIESFYELQYEISELANPDNTDIKKVLKKPFIKDISYQLIFMMPSGQTYIHRHTRPNEGEFRGITFPNVITSLPSSSNHYSASTVNNNSLIGTIELESGHKIYTILRHKPLDINWTSYRYWLPLMIAIMFFTMALLYTLKRRANWEQLLVYTDELSSHAKDAYIAPPFIEKKTTAEFLRLGHALSRISYQLHNNHRRITTLKHRLDRLVDHAPLPMLMIMRHGQISFFNQRFEQVFATPFQSDSNYQLTDFVFAEDETTQALLSKLAELRVTRTLLVYGLHNKKAYQLHITPWFGEHGQVHGFTVLLNNINEMVNQSADLQQRNQQLQRQLDEFNTLKSTLGHDLRLPLEAMIDTLEPIDPITLTVAQNEILNTLMQTSHSMLTMLNDMLDIGEIEVRKTRLNIEAVDLYKLGQEVSQSVVERTKDQGLELLYFFTPDSPRCIDTDHKRLQQILRYLLDNAVKFTTAGYVELTIDTVSNAEVLFIKNRTLIDVNKDSNTPKTTEINNDNASHSAHDWVRFSIKDSGIGIDIAKQHQILTYLNQSNNQNNRQSQNSNQANKPSENQHLNYIQNNSTEKGLGLNNANSFARLLGGFIEIKSTLTKGSTFNLYLPCKRPNYQLVYHLNPHLTQIHLLAVIKQPLRAEHLRRLCAYLSIPATISTFIDRSALQQLRERLAKEEQSLAPILLLDYEYYEEVNIALTNAKDIGFEKTKSIKTGDIATEHKKAEDEVSVHIDRQQALNSLLADTALPKILVSMKAERRIPSILLDRCDGFLNKPIDVALLLSELLRLTLPVRQTLIQPEKIQEDIQENTQENSIQLITAVEEASSETLAPLILVVEDSLTNQKIACKILAKLGYRSVVAEDGQQALDKLKEQRQEIALILMDCRMPVMDGLQATQAIRAQGDDIPIVALTANNTEEDRSACLQVGMNEFLAKPINKLKLQQILQTFIKS
ncbi:signal transduction histidine kinase/CheY-like chemotaxis protein [Psychrobacter luti]|uniref:histidine kinase n=1 Tax=Psychrobacter luti TaxID=198481 RepID=A0A839TAL5_9GAMM|nr:response regulator [Psychrobacter luti]MBB3106447.1 signal transduction histidine kinase/CheY-like chemotaxis protein [Psychrobacter luti]